MHIGMLYILISPPYKVFHGTILVALAPSRQKTLIPDFWTLSTVMIKLSLRSDSFCTLSTIMIDITLTFDTFHNLSTVIIELSLRFDT